MQFPLRRMVFETKDHEASGNSQTGCNSIDRIVPLDLLKKKRTIATHHLAKVTYIVVHHLILQNNNIK